MRYPALYLPGRRLLAVAFLLAFAAWLLPGAAHANVSVSGFTDAENYAPGNCAATGAAQASCGTLDASASASLATGVLAVQASCCAPNPPYISSGQSGADASYSDTITLVLPAGYAASTVPFARFILTVSGASISGLGRISDSLGIAPDFSKFYSAPSAGGCQSNDPQDFCGAPNSPLDLDITISNIPVNDLVIGITAGLSVVSRGSGASADAMDPGQLSILLPDGFSFTSASGVLLTQAVTAPEPSSLPLFAGFLGLAALAGVGQARRGVAARLSLAWRRISA